MDQIALNFLPLLSEDFTITLFRVPFVEGERPCYGGESAVRRTLDVDGKWRPYWTLFQDVPGSARFECIPKHNVYATLDACE